VGTKKYFKKKDAYTLHKKILLTRSYVLTYITFTFNLLNDLLFYVY